MLQVETKTRRRFALMLGAFFLLIFGLMLSGLWQRFGPENGAEADRIDETELARLRENATRVREARKQLADLGKQGKWDEAAALAQVKMQELDGGGLRFAYAEALYRAGHLDKAIKEFDEILDPAESEANSPNLSAVAVADRLALVRKIKEYRSHCEGLLKATPAEVSVLEANNTAWACVTAKEGLEDYTKPVELARKAVAGATEERDRWTYLNTLGVALYRAGQDKEAIERLTEAEKINSDVFNWPFLALAHHRLGNTKEAKTWYNRFHKKLDETYTSVDLAQSRHELLMFLREADETFAP